MNKHEEAYNLISGEVIFNALALGDERYKEIMKALDILRELAEKETPKKIRSIKIDSRIVSICPNCQSKLYCSECSYCPECGQKLDYGV